MQTKPGEWCSVQLRGRVRRSFHPFRHEFAEFWRKPLDWSRPGHLPLTDSMTSVRRHERLHLTMSKSLSAAVRHLESGAFSAGRTMLSGVRRLSGGFSSEASSASSADRPQRRAAFRCISAARTTQVRRVGRDYGGCPARARRSGWPTHAQRTKLREVSVRDRRDKRSVGQFQRALLICARKQLTDATVAADVGVRVWGRLVSWNRRRAVRQNRD
jgi:hypothetical protein